ncbi:bicyclomycin resistance protein [Apiospora kogelbergensis]|uniref:bicyclomycin resistance protein n=1 Tax=Apiospora kogelbergensis TaxID=1337665 RepID=UPI00312E1AEF
MKTHDTEAALPPPATVAGAKRNSIGAAPATSTDDSELEKGGQPSPTSPPSERKENNNAYFVRFEDGDPGNPKNWNKYYKAFITVQLGLLAMTGSMAASIVAPAEPIVALELGISREVAVLMVALFILGYAFGPVLWAPLSEVYGRRLSMLPAVFVMICFSIGTGFSRSPAAIFTTRFFGGVFGSAPISNVSAALGDIYMPRTRGVAMALAKSYAVCVMGGPTLAPVVGSALTIHPHLGWRYARYWHPHESEKIDLGNVFDKYLSRPILMFFTEPMVLCISLYASFIYGLLFLTLEVFPIVFREQRGFGPVVSTLPFLGLFVGVLTAMLINIANQPLYIRALERNEGRAVPEARLPPLILGQVLITTGLFWFGWTAAPAHHWALPVVAAGFIGAGFNIAFQQCLNFLVDTYGPFAASATSANTILRSFLACGLPLAARPMFLNLGVGPASSVLGAISCLAFPVPFLLMKYGPHLRKISRFAPMVQD